MPSKDLLRAARTAVITMLQNAGYRVTEDRDCEDRPVLDCVHERNGTERSVRVFAGLEPVLHEFDLTDCDFETRPVIIHVNATSPPHFRTLVPPYPYADPDTGLHLLHQSVRGQTLLWLPEAAVREAERWWQEQLRALATTHAA